MTKDKLRTYRVYDAHMMVLSIVCVGYTLYTTVSLVWKAIVRVREDVLNTLTVLLRLGYN